MSTADGRGRNWLDLPPVYLGGTILLMLLLHRVLPIVDVIDRPLAWLGLIPILAGIGLALWAERLFHAAGTGVLPFSPSTTLVVRGPYLFTRNPMYLAMLLTLAGLGLLLGSLGASLPIPAFFWLIRQRFVLREEAHLKRSFGSAYRAYQGRVRRWL